MLLQEMFRGGSIVVLSLVFAGMTTALVALGHPMSLLCVMAGLIYSEALGTTLGVLVGTIVTSIAVTVRRHQHFHHHHHSHHHHGEVELVDGRRPAAEPDTPVAACLLLVGSWAVFCRSW